MNLDELPIKTLPAAITEDSYNVASLYGAQAPKLHSISMKLLDP